VRTGSGGSASLKLRLISSYLVVLAAGGLLTSFVGSWIVSGAFMSEARRSAFHDLAAARTVYEAGRDALLRDVETAAADVDSALAAIASARAVPGLDFLVVLDREGRVVEPAPRPDARPVPAVALRPALEGRPSASTEVLGPDALGALSPALPGRARIPLATGGWLEDGLVQLAVAPVRGPGGAVTGVLAGGRLWNGDRGFVDRIWDLLYSAETWGDREAGRATIFLGGVRVATNVRNSSGDRAVGTPASDEVLERVLVDGETRVDRDRAVHDWYIAAYEPLRSASGDVVGMLSVGVLESRWTAVRNRVILSFFVIATLGFLGILAATWLSIRAVTRPLDAMVEATREIAAGRFDRSVSVRAPAEVSQLADSFNTMVAGLREMKHDQSEWAHTLEGKVRERTEELVSMQARISQSERLASVGMLAAGVAHEINNPLGGILALAALTLEDLPEEGEARENIAEVIRQTERCRDIVKGLLAFSRQAEVEREPTDVGDVLDAAIALVRKQALFFNVELVRTGPPGLPPVFADRSKLEQVFLNILMNAAQAIEDRGRIEIATELSEDGAHVEIRFADTGRGIPKEQLPHIFDPFFTTRVGGGGTGLGLAIAYGILAEHQATIAVDSDPGHGTTITIRFPVSPYSESGEAPTGPPAEPEPEPTGA
jgi:two-component system, NtrC family, sensor kinase